MSMRTPTPAEIAAAANQLYPDMVQFLADLIRIRSYTGQERPAVERTLRELEKIGCQSVWMDSAGNALGEIGQGETLLLYDAHLDTNEVSDESQWPFPPLEAHIQNDILYGLGASDCKGGVAAIVYGLAILNHLGLEPPCRVVVMGATLEEDAEGFALRCLVKRDGLRPTAVLLAEATNLTLRIGHRGRCEIRLRAQGRTAHASTPEMGENAILKLLPALQKVESLATDLPADPRLGRATQVITMITSPHTPNSVPEWCEAVIDRRTVPGETIESILQPIQAAVQPLGVSAFVPIQPVRTHTGLTLDDRAFFPGWLMDERHPLVQAGQATVQQLWNQPTQVDIWRFSTDGSFSAGQAGIPTLGFGPQEEAYVHTPFDQVNLQKVKKAAQFYALFPFTFTQYFQSQ